MDAKHKNTGPHLLALFTLFLSPSFTFRSARARASAISEQDKYMLTLRVLETFPLDNVTGDLELTARVSVDEGCDGIFLIRHE
jgi:hypothetical protein